MNERDLKDLFGRFAGARSTIQIPEAEDLLELSRLPHAEDAASPLHADLLRFSRELEPVSAQLGANLAAVFGESKVVSAHRRMSTHRVASAPRRWRVAIASSMAASLVVAVALFATHRSHAPVPASATAAHAVPDRIFAGFDERNVAADKAAHGDEIFRANFLPDEIFSSSRPHEG